MKCTECPEYNECSKKYNLTIRRRRCPKAKEEKVVTNADRIRTMTDEELAKELAMVAGWERGQYEKAKRIGIEKVMLDWLRQQAEGE